MAAVCLEEGLSRILARFPELAPGELHWFASAKRVRKG